MQTTQFFTQLLHKQFRTKGKAKGRVKGIDNSNDINSYIILWANQRARLRAINYVLTSNPVIAIIN